MTDRDIWIDGDIQYPSRAITDARTGEPLVLVRGDDMDFHIIARDNAAIKSLNSGTIYLEVKSTNDPDEVPAISESGSIDTGLTLAQAKAFSNEHALIQAATADTEGLPVGTAHLVVWAVVSGEKLFIVSGPIKVEEPGADDQGVPNYSADKFERQSNKGVPGGYAPLNSAGDIDGQYLTYPATFTPQGSWNVSTDTPDLSASSPTVGDAYRVSTGGTDNLTGSSIDWAEGDWAIYATSGWIRQPRILQESIISFDDVAAFEAATASGYVSGVTKFRIGGTQGGNFTAYTVSAAQALTGMDFSISGSGAEVVGSIVLEPSGGSATTTSDMIGLRDDWANPWQTSWFGFSSTSAAGDAAKIKGLLNCCVTGCPSKTLLANADHKFLIDAQLEMPTGARFVSRDGLAYSRSNAKPTLEVTYGASPASDTAAISDAAIIINRNNALKGFAVDYTSQVGSGSSTPTAYSWLLSTVKGKFYADNGTLTGGPSNSDGCDISELYLKNVYRGFYMAYFAQGYFGDIVGQPLFIGAYMNQFRDVVKLGEFHFWPFSAGSGTNLQQWVYDNGTGFIVGNVDGTEWPRPFCWQYNIGIKFIKSDIPGIVGGSNTGAFWGDVVAPQMDECNYPVVVEDVDNCNILGGALISSNPARNYAAWVKSSLSENKNISFIGTTYRNASVGVYCQHNTGGVTVSAPLFRTEEGSDLSDDCTFPIIHEGTGKLVIDAPDGGGANIKNVLGGVFGCHSDIRFDGVSFPNVTGSDIKPSGLDAAAGWTGSGVSDISDNGSGKLTFDLTAAATSAEFALDNLYYREVGPFVFQADIDIETTTSLGGATFQLSIKDTLNNRHAVLTNITPAEPFWKDGPFTIIVPFLCPFATCNIETAFGGSSDATAALTLDNITIKRVDRSTVSNGFLELLHDSPRSINVAGANKPRMAMKGTKKVIFTGNAAPTSGVWEAGDRAENTISSQSGENWAWNYNGTAFKSLGTIPL